MAYSTGGDINLDHIALIDVGAFGEVHKVNPPARTKIANRSFRDQTMRFPRSS
jgi:hypothetical protein